MGRRKTYDDQETLTRLTHLFWRRGYQATSLSHAEAATGLHRKSLLNRFGSKEDMFSAALGCYLEIKSHPEVTPLGEKPLGPENVERFFRALRYDRDDDPGCLLTLTVLERESVPDGAFELAVSRYREVERAFYDNLVPAVRDGRLSDRRQARSLSKFLLCAFHGIVVNARTGASNRDLKQVVDVIVRSLPVR